MAGFMTPGDLAGEARRFSEECPELVTILDGYATDVLGTTFGCWRMKLGWRECPCDGCQEKRDCIDAGHDVYELRPEYRHLDTWAPDFFFENLANHAAPTKPKAITAADMLAMYDEISKESCPPSPEPIIMSYREWKALHGDV